jgi:hypothetical protein
VGQCSLAELKLLAVIGVYVLVYATWWLCFLCSFCCSFKLASHANLVVCLRESVPFVRCMCMSVYSDSLVSSCVSLLIYTNSYI